ncbi:DMT family transporter [Paenibacillus enshidis]|uniref:DMT family transporter n=1 Tax=Paenibacillus enshidis TaxID=1458439 RepID=A0ABV5AWW4_9BACL
MGWIYLSMAIALELTGTIIMKYSAGFTRLLPSVLMFFFYGLSFASLNLAVRTLNLSLAYAMWSGLGTLLITLAGYYLFHEAISLRQWICIAIIVAGVIGLKVN